MLSISLVGVWLAIGLGVLWSWHLDSHSGGLAQQQIDAFSFFFVSEQDQLLEGWEMSDTSHLFLPTENNYTRRRLERTVGGLGGDRFSFFAQDIESGAVQMPVQLPTVDLDSELASMERVERFWFQAPVANLENSSQKQLYGILVNTAGDSLGTIPIDQAVSAIDELARAVDYRLAIEFGALLGAPIRQFSTGNLDLDSRLDALVELALDGFVFPVDGTLFLRVVP
ncbi:MAG: hypothetical protein HRU10_12810 [Opitutales bacterium]|nr:hypothetical protein [Opitutales bacterium]